MLVQTPYTGYLNSVLFYLIFSHYTISYSMHVAVNCINFNCAFYCYLIRCTNNCVVLLRPSDGLAQQKVSGRSEPTLDTTLSLTVTKNIPSGWGRISWLESSSPQNSTTNAYGTQQCIERHQHSVLRPVSLSRRSTEPFSDLQGDPVSAKVDRGSLKSLHRDLLDFRARYLGKEPVSGSEKCCVPASSRNSLVPFIKSKSISELKQKYKSSSPEGNNHESNNLHQSPLLPPRNTLNLGFELDRPAKSKKPSNAVTNHSQDTNGATVCDKESVTRYPRDRSSDLDDVISNKRKSSVAPELPARNPPHGTFRKHGYCPKPGEESPVVSSCNSSNGSHVSLYPAIVCDTDDAHPTSLSYQKPNTKSANGVNNHFKSGSVCNSPSEGISPPSEISSNSCNISSSETNLKERKRSASVNRSLKNRFKNSIKNSFLRKKSRSECPSDCVSPDCVKNKENCVSDISETKAITNTDAFQGDISPCAFTDFSNFETKCVSSTTCIYTGSSSFLDPSLSKCIKSDNCTSPTLSCSTSSDAVRDPADATGSPSSSIVTSPNQRLSTSSTVANSPQNSEVFSFPPITPGDESREYLGNDVSKTQTCNTEDDSSVLDNSQDNKEGEVGANKDELGANKSEVSSTTEVEAGATMSHHGASANYGTLRRGIKATTSRIIGASIRRPGMSPAFSLGKLGKLGNITGL